MTSLKSLNIVPLPKSGGNPTLDRRARTIARLEEQKLLLSDSTHMRTVRSWSKGDDGKKVLVETMALKFGQPELDRVVDDCFRPAVRRAGFELRILTDQQGAGLIDDQIRVALLPARFVISDLTHGSYGAYWEAGFGEGRGIPVIYTCEKTAWEENKSHFDTNHMATIIWDGSDLKKAEDALVAMIRATLRAEAKQTDD